MQSEAVGVQSEAVEVQSEARRGIATIPNQESIDINQSTRARTSELARLCGLKDDDEKMKMIEEDLHRRDVVDFVAYVRGIVENGTLADYLAGLDSRVRDVPELPTWRDDTPRPNNPADVRLRAAHGAGQHADGHYPQCSLCRAEAQE